MPRLSIYKNKKQLIESSIAPRTKVLDVGFWGQGVSASNPQWPHRLLKERGCDLYGLDIEYDEDRLLAPADHYRRESAEGFSFPLKFDVIFAGDLIEHLSNPGLFLKRAGDHIAPEGRLIMTTPNCFNLFNMTEKITKRDPTVNRDHTCYFNEKTLRQLLEKNGWRVEAFSYLYTLGSEYKESYKKKLLNCLYWFLSRFTDKFIETVVVSAVKA
jgi:2-polyprenyl-3-methyl-5-hydroxy-6-metoxy-1,4-benzoquinol methylase